MAGGRWYIALPAGPFRFSTRIACNRYFCRSSLCRGCTYIPSSRTCTRVGVYMYTCDVCARIYIMSGFQVSAADTFLGRLRSGGNYFGSMTDTRGPLYPARCRCGIFISSQDVRGRRERERERERPGRTGSFYERIYPFSSEFDLYGRVVFRHSAPVYLSFYSKRTSRPWIFFANANSSLNRDTSRLYPLKCPLKFECQVTSGALSKTYHRNTGARSGQAVAIGPESARILPDLSICHSASEIISESIRYSLCPAAGTAAEIPGLLRATPPPPPLPPSLER